MHVLRAVRLERRTYCRHACADDARAALMKAELDAQDTNRMTCRCAGAPRAVEATGRHCAECRRMFSIGVREMLAARARRRRRPLTRFRELLHSPLRLPALR